MAQSDHQLLIQSPYYILSAVLAAIWCIAALLSGELLVALIALSIAGLLGWGKVKGADVRDLKKARTLLKWLFLGLAAVAMLAILVGASSIKVWLFTVPLFIFFFFEFKPAIIGIAVFSLIGALVLNEISSPFINIQFVSSYILYLGISCALVYLREVRRKQLKPLRRTDNLTQAATKEHLDDDLTKEIQRSEREGSELAVMALAIDENCLDKLSTKQKSALMIEIGRLLHNNLRVFDSYYGWGEDQFLIVLPHTSSAQANKIANELRVKVRKEVSLSDEKVTVSVGIVGLNVGDDSKALPEKATEALKYSQSKGNNRTQLFRDREEASDDMRSSS